MDDPRWSYLEGYEAASNPEPLKCPHAHGTAESEQWWDGVGDGLSAMIDAKLALRPGEDARAVALIAKLREAKSSDEAVAIAAKAIRHAEDDAIEQCAVASRHGVSARRDKTMPKGTQTRSHAVAAERPPHPIGMAVLGLVTFAALIAAVARPRPPRAGFSGAHAGLARSSRI